jgi:hypothetical protein
MFKVYSKLFTYIAYQSVPFQLPLQGIVGFVLAKVNTVTVLCTCQMMLYLLIHTVYICQVLYVRVRRF